VVWDEVGDGCFRRRYRSFDLNIGVVRGSDALLVVDTRANRRQADELLAELAAFGRPVRWVVNSHWHFDHTFGNQRFVDRAQGRGHSAGAADVSAALELWGHADLPEMMRGYEPELEAGFHRSDGEASEEYDGIVLTPPDHLVRQNERLDLGDRSVELVHVGLGHTNNDLTVVVPGSAVVFAGDLLEQSAPPSYGDDSFPLSWPGTARALLELDASTFVPGHGDLMDHRAAADQVDALAAVASLIRHLHGAGIAVEDALREGRGRWPFPAEVLTHAVRRGYEALT
jgi:glyoxylase-like metal-dependent hydrolase (beta-lactamase superfamily II)